MDKLYKKLENFTTSSAIKIENSDPQFLSLKKLFNEIKNKKFFLPLIIANSLICYQLSWKWENYWEEFAVFFWKNPVDEKNFLEAFEKFLNWCKNNRRLLKIKFFRLKKFFPFLKKFSEQEKFFYDNLEIFLEEIAKIMCQKKSAKTIVFAVKMFWYWWRIFFGEEKIFPKNIKIPIDSRLEKIFEKYWKNYKNSKNFFENLSEKLQIPELHLDAILWVNFKEIIKITK